jgi:hypothetical protein
MNQRDQYINGNHCFSRCVSKTLTAVHFFLVLFNYNPVPYSISIRNKDLVPYSLFKLNKELPFSE